MIILAPPFLSADTLKKDDGTVLTGTILDEDAGYLYLETSAGIINVPKVNIMEKNSKPFDSGPKDTAEQRYGTGVQTQTDAGGLGLEKNLVARIGAGGIGETEFYWYLVRAGHQGIQSWRDVPEAQRKPVLEKAIEDELLFQEGLRLKFHQEAVTKKNIAELYKGESVIAGVEPSQMKTEDIRAFYDAHPELFKKPAQFLFKTMALNQIKVDLEKAKRDPSSVTGWRSAGWLNQGDEMYLPFTQSTVDQIYAMKKGEVKEFQDGMGGNYLYWLTDYKASQSKPFEQSIEKVKHEMVKAKTASNTKAFDQQFKQSSGQAPTVDELFKEALKAGKHRDRFIRDGVISAYAASKGQSRDHLASGLKKIHPVEILIEHGE